MSLILLIGASLFVRSFLNLQNATVGFDTAPLMTLRFYLPGTVYDPSDAKSRRVQDIVRRVEGLPGVQAAFASNFVPLGVGGSGGHVIVEGKTAPRGEEPAITFITATPRLRQTLNVALVSGRDLTESEELTKSPMALVNQTMARQLWPDANPIGRRFRLIGSDETPEWFTVVGVIADFRHGQGASNRPIFPSAYVPYSFGPTLNTGLTVRVSGEPSRITSAVRDQIRLSDPALPVFQFRTMEDLRQFSFWRYKLFGWMFSAFGAVALLLASIGVYGVLSYSVSQRRQEIGVRVALGAARKDVLRLIVGQGLTLAGIGILVGIVGALGVTQFIKTLLYNVTASDPASFTIVAIFLAVVAIVASYVPARRALAVDPITALRND
jgi:putative ABC transport system permease protein